MKGAATHDTLFLRVAKTFLFLLFAALVGLAVLYLLHGKEDVHQTLANIPAPANLAVSGSGKSVALPVILYSVGGALALTLLIEAGRRASRSIKGFRIPSWKRKPVVDISSKDSAFQAAALQLGDMFDAIEKHPEKLAIRPAEYVESKLAANKNAFTAMETRAREKSEDAARYELAKVVSRSNDAGILEPLTHYQFQPKDPVFNTGKAVRALPVVKLSTLRKVIEPSAWVQDPESEGEVYDPYVMEQFAKRKKGAHTPTMQQRFLDFTQSETAKILDPRIHFFAFLDEENEELPRIVAFGTHSAKSVLGEDGKEFLEKGERRHYGFFYPQGESGELKFQPVGYRFKEM